MDVVKICEVVDGCEDCPKYGDDCDGDKMTEHTDLISRADAIAYIDRVTNSGLGRNKSLDYIHKYISALPSADAVEVKAEQLPPKVPTEWINDGMVLVPQHDWIEMQKELEGYVSADAVQGEWEHWGSPFSDESEVIDTIVCSVCGARFIEPKDEPKGEYNYCPNCGSRMTPYKGGDTE